MQERDQLHQMRLQELRDEIQTELNSGEATPLDMQDIKATRQGRQQPEK